MDRSWGPRAAYFAIARMSIGSDQTRLIAVRGNSGSGKSTVAKSLHEAYGSGPAWVSHDLTRRQAASRVHTAAALASGSHLLLVVQK